MRWIVTNENGFRREFKDGVIKEMSRINSLSQTDPKTGIVTKLREDNVILIKYTDGKRYCQHADGTMIFCQEGDKQIRIEKEGYAPVMHQLTESGEDTDDWLETEDIKSINGKMTQVFLPDGCIIKTIKFWKSNIEKDRIVLKHIFQRQDYSCIMVDSDGDVRVITVNSRSAINEADERSRLGLDTDYLK
jgi:hypothetical protein